MLEDIELIGRVPLFRVKRQFDCPLSKNKVDSGFCSGCPNCKNHLRIVGISVPLHLEVYVECTLII